MAARFRLAISALALLCACGPVARHPEPASGEIIAFGGGPGGASDACFTCHGVNGEGDRSAPRLAGLSAGYAFKQLQDYAADARADAVMGPVARRLSESDRLAVAHYFAALEAPIPSSRGAPAIYVQGDSARGVRACVDCHGASGTGRGAANPAIIAQPPEYTAEQLRRFRASTRRNDPSDVMGRATRPLTDAEINALAAYLAP